jgi:hypothetical protein
LLLFQHKFYQKAMHKIDKQQLGKNTCLPQHELQIGLTMNIQFLTSTMFHGKMKKINNLMAFYNSLYPQSQNKIHQIDLMNFSTADIPLSRLL